MNNPNFNQDDWVTHLELGATEEAFLANDFPVQMELCEYLDEDPSDIDSGFHEIDWFMSGADGAEPGVFMGFVSADEYRRAFADIEEEPHDLCHRRMRVTIERHDDPTDPKSHFNWGCWLELTQIEFLGWVSDEELEVEEDVILDCTADDGWGPDDADGDAGLMPDSPMSIEEIQHRAQVIIDAGLSDSVTAYLLENLESEPGDTDINRCCGTAIGVSLENWPERDGQKMEHAITLDLSSTPRLKAQFPANTAAVAVFVSSLDFNEAFEPGTDETAVLLLTDQDLARGVNAGAGPANDESESSTFVAHEVMLPIEVFAEDIHERDEDDPVYELNEALCEFSMAGGKPIWLQGVDHDGEIILQFDDSLVDMNLGDGGVMYVFRDTAFWQCH